MLKGVLNLRESGGKDAKQCKSQVSALPALPAGHEMEYGSLVVGRLDCKHQTNNRKHRDQPVAQCKSDSQGRRMPTRIENWVTAAGKVLTQLSHMVVGKRSSEQLEVAHFTRKFRKGFNQMKDRLEAPAEKPVRGSNPTGSNRRQFDRPFPYIIIGAIVAVGLVFDLVLIINAGGIPGVSIPGVTQTATAKVNNVATKVAAVAEVVDDLAGDEEEYIVEDIEASGDYDDDLPSLPVLDFTDENPDKGS